MSTPSTIGALREDGGLSYRLREPLAARPTAAVFLLHGVGGNETNLADLAMALDPSLLAVLVRAPQSLGPNQYGWFRVAFTADGPRIDADAAETSRVALSQFVAELAQRHGVAPGNTIVAGFSQGGIMSASVALSAPERVCGFGILSGRILPELKERLASRERLAGLRAFVSHGDLDDKLPVSWAQRTEAWLTELDVPFATHRYQAGHTLTAAMAADFVAWVHGLVSGAPVTGFRAGDESIRASVADERSITLLQLDDQETRILTSAPRESPSQLILAMGAQRTASEFFQHAPPRPEEVENAIMVVEDQLLAARTAVSPDSRLFTEDPGIREIALLAGLPDAPEIVLSREAMENLFNRFAAVVQGRPAAFEGIPVRADFAARLLILREFMHHLHFESITIRRP